MDVWYLQIVKQRILVSHKIHMKSLPLSQITPRPFTAKSHLLILSYRSHVLIHHRLISRRKVTEGENIKELTQGRSHIHVQNVGNVTMLNHIWLDIREVTQERSHFLVQNVGNALQLNQTLFIIRELTQERSRFLVQNVGNVLQRNQNLLYTRDVTQRRSHFFVQNVGDALQ
ncbi:hypothetical protein GDO78_018576 [Eleutherodactylus coqui]|uniref:Uncharacterized protein n=1 Tax=Eleutherodactylus coqui TaxID=57060 RepID=A0A8J6BCA5_ELECQ|nr:hypothetical protein GDO78_018576 [Eleutherodactylus coqui]